jgi:hypothetical protein
MTRIQVKWLLAPDKKEDDPQRMEATHFQISMFGQFNDFLLNFLGLGSVSNSSNR